LYSQPTSHTYLADQASSHAKVFAHLRPAHTI
jgi:hypothetical protein